MIKKLTDIPIEIIVDCLHDSFADYVVPMKASVEYWETRLNAGRVNYDYSFGYFDDDNLVGFVLHGIDDYEGGYTFFNLGTGIIPAFRGQRIVKQIYQQAIPLLKEKNITQGYLEVITSNEKAIKAYESVGFEIMRTYHSFSPRKATAEHTYSEILKDSFNVSDYDYLQGHHNSWEQNNATLLRDPAQFTALELWDNDAMCAYAIIKSSNKNVTQFGVKNDNWDAYGKPLFSSIKVHHPSYRIINIDANDSAVMDFFLNNGFPALIDQYEMRIEL